MRYKIIPQNSNSIWIDQESWRKDQVCGYVGLFTTMTQCLKGASIHIIIHNHSWLIAYWGGINQARLVAATYDVHVVLINCDGAMSLSSLRLEVSTDLWRSELVSGGIKFFHSIQDLVFSIDPSVHVDFELVICNGVVHSRSGRSVLWFRLWELDTEKSPHIEVNNLDNATPFFLARCFRRQVGENIESPIDQDRSWVGISGQVWLCSGNVPGWYILWWPRHYFSWVEILRDSDHWVSFPNCANLCIQTLTRRNHNDILWFSRGQGSLCC